MFKLFQLFAIASPAYSVIITCKFENHFILGYGGRYVCNVMETQNLGIAEVTQIIGNHSADTSHDDVHGFLSFREDLFSTFPKHLDKFFENLDSIRLTSSGLTSITADNLAPWPNLEHLDLSSNRIKSLDGDLF